MSRQAIVKVWGLQGENSEVGPTMPAGSVQTCLRADACQPCSGSPEKENEVASYTTTEQSLIDVWEAHTAAEFAEHSADAAIATMTDHPSLTHVPVGTGATGCEAVRRFYAEVFIPQAPPDIELELLSRTVGQNRIVDEFILHLTHTLRMDWFAPGVEATGRRLAVPHVGIIHFERGKIASEHIYWDHASLLLQLGVLPENRFPVMGAEQCARLKDVESPANELMTKWE